MLKVMKFIFYSELIHLLRRSQEWLYPLVFFLLIMSLFPLAITSLPLHLEKLIPGYIWVAALLASLLTSQTCFATEIEDGNIEQWLLSENPLAILLFVKLSAQWLLTQIPLVLLTPLLGILFHLPFTTILALCSGLLLGTPILTFVNSFGIALTLGLRQQGILLGLLILPLVIPVLLMGVIIVNLTQAGLPTVGAVSFLAGLLVLTLTLLPYLTAATLRLSCDD